MESFEQHHEAKKENQSRYNRLSDAREAVIKAMGAAWTSHARPSCECDPCDTAHNAVQEYNEANNG